MAETVKIRLVRCPNCANVLTELPHFSLYKCGGCGAVLQGTAPTAYQMFAEMFLNVVLRVLREIAHDNTSS